MARGSCIRKYRNILIITESCTKQCCFRLCEEGSGEVGGLEYIQSWPMERINRCAECDRRLRIWKGFTEAEIFRSQRTESSEFREA